MTLLNHHYIPSSKRVLDPIDRVSEILFGLIMVLTVTCSISVVEAGRTDIRWMLLGALGCNLAWGIIDAVLYLLACIAEQGKGLLALKALRKTSDPQKAHQIIADALPPLIASILQPPEFETIRRRLNELPEPPDRIHLRKNDWMGALAVFLLVFLSTFPVVLPFTLIQNPTLALRISHVIAVVSLFLTGCAFGRITGRRPWLRGIAMLIVGAILVGLTIALGG